MKKTFIIKNCSYCGAEFKANKQIAKYCSPSCRTLFCNHKKTRTLYNSIGNIPAPSIEDIELLIEKNKSLIQQINDIENEISNLENSIRRIKKGDYPNIENIDVESLLNSKNNKIKSLFLKLRKIYMISTSFKIELSKKSNAYSLINNLSMIDRVSFEKLIDTVLQFEKIFLTFDRKSNQFPIEKLSILGDIEYPFLTYFTEGNALATTSFSMDCGYLAALYLDLNVLFICHSRYEKDIYYTIKDSNLDFTKVNKKFKLESITLLSELEPLINKNKPNILILDNLTNFNIKIESDCLNQLKRNYCIGIIFNQVETSNSIENQCDKIVKFDDDRMIEVGMIAPKDNPKGIGIKDYHYKYNY